jgi:hypothetical protein
MRKQFSVFIFTVLLLTVFACKKQTPVPLSGDGFEIEGTVLVKYSADAENVIIPEGITVIGDYAFNDCENITSVTIPEGVTVIEENAFRDRNNITSVTIPEGVTSIGDSAFYRCNNLRTVSVSRKTKIGEGAFPANAQITYSD